MPSLLRATTWNPCDKCACADEKRPDQSLPGCADCTYRTDYIKIVGHDIGMKHCPRCDRTLDESEFAADASRPDGKKPTCKKCQAKARKAATTKMKGRCNDRD